VSAGDQFDPCWRALQALGGTSPVTGWLAESLLENFLLPIASADGNVRMTDGNGSTSESDFSPGRASVLSLELDGGAEGSSREAALLLCFDFVHGKDLA
jgi:hypothetical protein